MLQNNQNNGLNLIRAFAVIFVFINHIGFAYIKNVSDISYFFYYFSGFIGVEIFFVLSGFLIGNIILKLETYTYKNLNIFIVRRWLRTLPLYYLFLCINYLIFLPKFNIFSKFLLFSQNDYLSQTQDNVFFPVSWSLSVEELFYIVIPILFFLIHRMISSKKTVVIILLLLTLFVHYYISQDLLLDFKTQRSLAYLRFDSLLFGFLLAAFPSFLNFIRNFLQNNFSLILFSIILFIFTFLLFIISVNEHSTLVFISMILINFSCMLIISFSYNLNINKIYFFDVLAKISYPFYLIHATIIYFFAYLLAVNTLNTIITVFCSFIISFYLSYLIHKYIEKPIMEYRNNKFKPIEIKISHSPLL